MKISSFSSLSALNQLSLTQKAIGKSLQRLSSGKRLNTASDDVASFSTAVRLNSQVRGLSVALRNMNDSKGLLNVTEAGLQTQLNILQKMRELSVQAASSTLNSTQRESLQNELQTLVSEYDRIVEETEFNGQYVLQDGLDSFQIQSGPNSEDQLGIDLEDSRLSSLVQKATPLGAYDDAEQINFDGSIQTYKTGDLDGDGDEDIVAMMNPSGPDNYIEILLNDGDGSFSSLTTFEAGVAPALELSDIDGDGSLDISYLLRNDEGYDDVVTRFGNDNAGFSDAQVTLSTTAIFGRLNSRDLDNDGNQDLVLSRDNGASIYTALGNGDGTFQSAQSGAVGDQINTIEFGDLNGDGFDDLVYSYYEESILYIHYGNGDGTFDFGTEKGLGGIGDNVADASIGDIDGDGDLDLLITSSTDSGSGGVFIAYNQGEGVFTSSGTFADYQSDLTISTDRHKGASLSDFDGDGDLDLFVGNQSENATDIYKNNGDGSFTFADRIESGGITVPTEGNERHIDIDGDGIKDFIHDSDTDLNLFAAQTYFSNGAPDLSLASAEQAAESISLLDTAIENASGRLSQIGIAQNRIDIRMNQALLLRENYAEAENRLSAVDYASETAELVRTQILQQSQLAVLTQANIQMELVLELFPPLG